MLTQCTVRRTQLKIQLMGVFTLAQAIFWGYLHFETTFHPEVLQLPKWMIPVGGLFVVLSSFGTHFMAKTSVAYAALTKGGTHAKLSTFKMTGVGSHAPCPYAPLILTDDCSASTSPSRFLWH